MAEPVARRHRPIRPLGGPTRPQELLPPHQLLTLVLDPLDFSLHPGGHRSGGEFCPGHARHLQQALGLGTQALNLLRDHLLEALRNLGRYCVV